MNNYIPLFYVDVIANPSGNRDANKTKESTTQTLHIDGLVQEMRNSIANAKELRLSCTNLWTFLSMVYILFWLRIMFLIKKPVQFGLSILEMEMICLSILVSITLNGQCM